MNFFQGPALSEPSNPESVQQDFWRQRDPPLLQLSAGQDSDLQNERPKADLRKMFGGEIWKSFNSSIIKRNLLNDHDLLHSYFQVDLMDESILLSAKSIILKKLSSGENDSSETSERIKSLENSIQTLSKKLDLLIRKLE